MSAETDWSAVSDAAHRDWVDSERNEKLEELEAEVIRLRAELNAATKAGLDAIATICEKEREADALRAEMEWLRSWLPPMLVLVSAVEEEFCCEETEASEPDHSKVSYPEETCPITFGMIRDARKAIDYAMGEGK